MAKSVPLSDAIDEYLAVRKVAARPATLVMERSTLKRTLNELGNLQTRHLDVQHGEKMAALFAKTQQPQTTKAEFSRLRAFSKWLKARSYLAVNHAPFETTQLPKPIHRQQLRVPVSEFPALLDAARTPRDRIIVAIGLYLFLRAAEIRRLKVNSLDFDAKEVLVHVTKTDTEPDGMPMCDELEEELHIWLQWYRANARTKITPEHLLVPSLTSPRLINVKGHRGCLGVEQHLVPDRPVNQPERVVQYALQAIGYPVRDINGKSLNEGVHTLRRSGARAYYDSLLDRGHDYAGRTVQAMLHHKSLLTTEIYLGVDADKKRRNELLKGKSMYGAKKARVLRLVAGEGD